MLESPLDRHPNSVMLIGSQHKQYYLTNYQQDDTSPNFIPSRTLECVNIGLDIRSTLKPSFLNLITIWTASDTTDRL